MNRKRLYTTQSLIDPVKLARAHSYINNKEYIHKDPPQDPPQDSPSGWVSIEKGILVYTLGDGNHRTGLACINGVEIPFLITGIWEEGVKDLKRFGFNIIVQKIRNELIQR